MKVVAGGGGVIPASLLFVDFVEALQLSEKL